MTHDTYEAHGTACAVFLATLDNEDGTTEDAIVVATDHREVLVPKLTTQSWPHGVVPIPNEFSLGDGKLYTVEAAGFLAPNKYAFDLAQAPKLLFRFGFYAAILSRSRNQKLRIHVESKNLANTHFVVSIVKYRRLQSLDDEQLGEFLKAKTAFKLPSSMTKYNTDAKSEVDAYVKCSDEAAFGHIAKKEDIFNSLFQGLKFGAVDRATRDIGQKKVVIPSATNGVPHGVMVVAGVSVMSDFVFLPLKTNPKIVEAQPDVMVPSYFATLLLNSYASDANSGKDDKKLVKNTRYLLAGFKDEVRVCKHFAVVRHEKPTRIHINVTEKFDVPEWVAEKSVLACIGTGGTGLSDAFFAVRAQGAIIRGNAQKLTEELTRLFKAASESYPDSTSPSYQGTILTKSGAIEVSGGDEDALMTD